MTEQEQIHEEMRYFEKLREACVELQNKEGWKLYVQYMQEDMSKAVKSAATTMDPYASARYLGAWNALSACIDWPAQQIKAVDINIATRREQLDLFSR